MGAVAALLALALALAGCSDGSDGGFGGNDTITAATITDDGSDDSSYTYSASGSTVAISADGLELQLGYSSGQLLYIQKAFTKVS